MIVKKPRTEGKIKSHYGIREYYKFFKQDHPELDIDYKRYVKVITEFNEGLIDLIIEDNVEYSIPYIGSTLSVKKDKRVPKIVNGKLYNTSPVDWVATNKLWSEDDEAHEKKLLVRFLNTHTMRNVFRIYFKKFKLMYQNKNLYKFETCRDFARALGQRINDEDKPRYDAYLIYQNEGN